MKFLKKKDKNIEYYRIKIDSILKNNELKNNKAEKKFYLFLYNDDFNQFDTWFKICSAKNNFNENINILENILDIFNKSDSIISFKRLYEIDINWYNFFKQNSDINGKILLNEKRLGVDKNYVKDICIIQNKIKEFNRNLDLSIEFYQKLKLNFFLQYHKN